jgi:hypothetical protein
MASAAPKVMNIREAFATFVMTGNLQRFARPPGNNDPAPAAPVMDIREAFTTFMEAQMNTALDKEKYEHITHKNIMYYYNAEGATIYIV